MKVHVFDTYVTIKDREGHPDMDDTLLEKLDEMLTTYGVPHAFSLPHEKTMEECPEATLEVAYDSSDDITFSLMYILFNKTYGGFCERFRWGGNCSPRAKEAPQSPSAWPLAPTTRPRPIRPVPLK